MTDDFDCCLDAYCTDACCEEACCDCCSPRPRTALAVLAGVAIGVGVGYLAFRYAPSARAHVSPLLRQRVVPLAHDAVGHARALLPSRS